jgi:hypothetical protein
MWVGGMGVGVGVSVGGVGVTCVHTSQRTTMFKPSPATLILFKISTGLNTFWIAAPTLLIHVEALVAVPAVPGGRFPKTPMNHMSKMFMPEANSLSNIHVPSETICLSPLDIYIYIYICSYRMQTTPEAICLSNSAKETP